MLTTGTRDGYLWTLAKKYQIVTNDKRKAVPRMTCFLTWLHGVGEIPKDDLVKSPNNEKKEIFHQRCFFITIRIYL
jgi:hypothetical protein